MNQVVFFSLVVGLLCVLSGLVGMFSVVFLLFVGVWVLSRAQDTMLCVSLLVVVFLGFFFFGNLGPKVLSFFFCVNAHGR